MRIIIVGPGAIGLLLYSFLKGVNEETYLLDKSESRAKFIQGNGIKVEGLSGPRYIRDVHISSKAQDLPEADLLIIAVKSYDTEDAVRRALPCIGDRTLVASFQNGLGNFELISKYVPEGRIIAGVTNHGATLLSHGHVKHAGSGETVIGFYERRSMRTLRTKLEEIVRLFKRAGLDLKIEEDMEKVIWSKLLINVGINALTALTNLKNGYLVKIEPLRRLMHLLVEEAHILSRKKGIKLIYPDPHLKVEEVCEKTADNISSMLQDILRGKRTEVDAINGAVVRESKKIGLNAVHNEFITELIHGVEAGVKERIYRL